MRKKRGMPQAKKETQKDKSIFFLAVLIIVIVLVITVWNNQYQATGQFSTPADDKCPDDKELTQMFSESGKTFDDAANACKESAAKADFKEECAAYCKTDDTPCVGETGEVTIKLDSGSYTVHISKDGKVTFNAKEKNKEGQPIAGCSAETTCKCNKKSLSALNIEE